MSSQVLMVSAGLQVLPPAPVLRRRGEDTGSRLEQGWEGCVCRLLLMGRACSMQAPLDVAGVSDRLVSIPIFSEQGSMYVRTACT